MTPEFMRRQKYEIMGSFQLLDFKQKDSQTNIIVTFMALDSIKLGLKQKI